MLIAKTHGGIFMSVSASSARRAAAGKERSLAVCIPLGVSASLLSGLLLLAVSAAVCLKAKDPDPITTPLALCSLFFGAMTGGHVCARLHGKNRGFCGALSGLFFVALLILIAFATGSALRPALFGICAPCTVLLSAIAGAVSCRAKRDKGRKRSVRAKKHR
jgi:putative membrane protein (TIGR04086 family)